MHNHPRAPDALPEPDVRPAGFRLSWPGRAEGAAHQNPRLLSRLVRFLPKRLSRRLGRCDGWPVALSFPRAEAGRTPVHSGPDDIGPSG